jgi:hypothetical protein
MKYSFTLSLIIILVAFLLRFSGITYGLPYSIGHFDELISVRIAMAFGATRSLRPITLLYPSFYSYILFCLYSIYFLIGLVMHIFRNLVDFAFIYLTRPGNFYFLGRLISVIVSTLTVALTYQIGKQIYNKNIGLIAALLLSFSPSYVLYSHWAKPDITMCFLSALSLLFICLIFDKRYPRYYLLAGLFAGLAVATKYNAMLLVFPLFIGHLLAVKNRNKNLLQVVFDRWIIAAYVMFILGFLLGCPYYILNFKSLYEGLLFNQTMVRIGEVGNFGTMPYVWIIKDLISLDLSIGLIFILGCLYVIIRPKRQHWLFLSFILTSFLYIGAWRKESLHYFLIAFPALSIIGAVFLNELYSKFLKEKKWWAFLGIFMIIVFPCFRIIKTDYRMLNKDTRILAKEWIEENIPTNTKIALHSIRYKEYPPILSAKGSEFTSYDYGPKARGVYRNASLDRLLADYLSRHPAYLIYKLEKKIESVEVDKLLQRGGNKSNSYLRSGYSQGWREISELKELGVEYIILSSFLYEKYNASSPEKNHPLYTLFMRNKNYLESLMNLKELLLVKEFMPGADNLGPVLKIYKFVY